MSAVETLRRRLRARAPATSGRLDESAFLLSGAAVGGVGWTATQALAWLDPTRAALAVTGLWVLLVSAFTVSTVRHGPDAARFSDAMFVWATVNTTAMAATFAGLAGLVPPSVAFWHAWVAAAAVGYCWTGGLLEGAGDAERGRAYLVSGLVALAVLLLGGVRFPLVEPVAFLLLGLIHVVPLALDARRVSER